MRYCVVFFLVFSLGGWTQPVHACPFDLPTATIVIKGHKLSVEWAATPRERSCGLSNRSSLDKNSGMLFVYPSERPLSFWMKDTQIPLSIAFLDAGGRIINIETMAPFQTMIKYRSNGPARYALEVNQGWFRANRIGVGDRVMIGETKSSETAHYTLLLDGMSLQGMEPNGRGVKPGEYHADQLKR